MSSTSGPKEQSGCKNIFIIRHGERVDFTFGEWVDACFAKDGNYVRTDLNMPVRLPKRNGYPQTFKLDTPLTNVGVLEATVTGEDLALKGFDIKYAYCSPALRCVQTCNGVLTGLNIADKLQIKIEPGLFEWMIWHRESFPQFMEQDELIAAGFNIDTSYKPYLSKAELKSKLHETSEQYYERSHNLVEKILQSLKNEGPGNVLLVGHGTSLDSCSRLLRGLKPRDRKSLLQHFPKVPYCGLVHITKTDAGEWKVPPRSIPPISHSLNKPLDYNEFCSDDALALMGDHNM